MIDGAPITNVVKSNIFVAHARSQNYLSAHGRQKILNGTHALKCCSKVLHPSATGRRFCFLLRLFAIGLRPWKCCFSRFLFLTWSNNTRRGHRFFFFWQRQTPRLGHRGSATAMPQPRTGPGSRAQVPRAQEKVRSFSITPCGTYSRDSALSAVRLLIDPDSRGHFSGAILPQRYRLLLHDATCMVKCCRSLLIVARL